MKKFVSLGLCCLLCTMHLTAADANSAQNLAEARDAKTSNILSNVVKVVEGIINIIKIIKDARHDKLNVKVHAESELAQAVSNIKNIAAVSLPLEELSRESVQELCEMLREVAATIQPLLREYIKEDVASVHDYLQNAPLQELQQQLQILNDMEAQPDLAIGSSDEHEKEFHAHIIQALHSLVQSLFSIIQAPENPKVIGQNIADMLSNIINVASQTLKYEYMSSRDAEENVAIYLESFSNELTKEIKHLMLQTALHLRGCKQIRACCNNGCSNGCNSCGSCSTVCRPCCKPCGTCSLNMEQEDAITRACPSCGCGNCVGGCCSYGTRKPGTLKEILRKAIIRNNKRRASTTCNSCGKNCNTCGCKKKITEIQQEADATRCNCGAKPKPRPNRSSDESTKCGCGAKPKPQPNRAEDAQTSDDSTKCGCGKPRPQNPTTNLQDAQDEQTKCGCGAKPKPQPNTVARNNLSKSLANSRKSPKNLIFPEGYKG